MNQIDLPLLDPRPLKDQALAALNELPSVRQGIGKLGYMLRRCKPGTKRHKEIWDNLTRLENEACHLSTTIRLALHSLPPSTLG